MNIANLSDQSKSVLLAKAMGWTIFHTPEEIVTDDGWGYFESWICDNQGKMIVFPYGDSKIQWTTFGLRPSWPNFKLNLYKPVNIVLAKKVAEWAYRIDLSGFIMYLENYAFAILVEENGLRIMLDKILELAIAAELIEVTRDN